MSNRSIEPIYFIAGVGHIPIIGIPLKNQPGSGNMRKLQEMAENYRPIGINKGGEFLLQIKDGIRFIEDLAKHDILIIGCDLWRYVDRDKNWIVELLGAGIDIGNHAMTARQAADYISDWLTTKIPEGAEFVSLIFADPALHHIFV